LHLDKEKRGRPGNQYQTGQGLKSGQETYISLGNNITQAQGGVGNKRIIGTICQTEVEIAVQATEFTGLYHQIVSDGEQPYLQCVSNQTAEYTNDYSEAVSHQRDHSTAHMMPENINLKNPIHLLALGFGAGCSPIMPGTVGTMVGIPFYYLLHIMPLPLYLLVIVLLFAAGIWLCQQTARDMGVHDHPAIVWDEIVGFLVTMIMVPSGWLWVLAGFVLFRAFDILKPWPVSWADRHVKGGLGIMLDDLVAAICALVLLQITSYVL